MDSSLIYQQKGKGMNNGNSSGNSILTSTSINNNTGNGMNKSLSSNFMISNNHLNNGNNYNKTEPPTVPTPNGYRVAPTKIPTKAEIDYHLENFIMSRKIALNGGNELRIDDKNISLHLNNPFVSSSPYSHLQQQKIFMQQQQHQQQQKQQIFQNSLLFNETINETTLMAPSAVDQSRPKRPHSIAVSSPINLNTSLNNDLNVATLSRRQKITTPNIVSGGMMNKITTTAAGEQKINSQYCSPINFSQLNHFNGNGSSPSPGRMQAPFRSLKSEFSLYTPPSPVIVSEADGLQQHKQPPNVPQRRSQSIPRQVMTQSFTTTNGQTITGVQTLNRPRSLDRYSTVGMRTTNAHSSPHNQHISTMKQSVTFHGQQMLNQACYQSDIYEEVGQHMKGDQQQQQQQQKKERPMSFAYGTVPEQVYLENQLRMYQEQLKNITESMKKYQEQTRILNELKRQQSLDRQKSSVPSSKSDSKLSQNLKLNSTTSINTVADEVQTPSHQLKLFLDNIRNSIKEPSFENDVSDHETDGNGKLDVALKVVNKVDEKINVHQSKPNNVEVKTPSDQLRLFLDAIRHNQNIETHQRTDVPKVIPEANEENFEMKRSETFSQVTDNIKLLNQDLESFNDKTNVTNVSKNMDQILDEFNRMASLLKTNNSVDYLQKCSEALKQTTEQIRQMNGNNYSSDDSSCSTTPGSIREAVQNLLSQPRNGFQIMDDRMSIFIDIIEQQGRFSQVITLRSLYRHENLFFLLSITCEVES
ncbi:CLUMA_CG005808, isoform A [Clunio marinus]|uniref:CLUMA_CG005808, isoform A n=1 Tax=Clunio marinus TaxID=568069 RepID=A0A1J1HVW3_9DIPT|nr:CLUMA_CG005808, isoform A [Clunio marinus]